MPLSNILSLTRSTTSVGLFKCHTEGVVSILPPLAINALQSSAIEWFAVNSCRENATLT